MKFNISYKDITFSTELTIRSRVREIKEAIRGRTEIPIAQQLIFFVDEDGKKIILDDDELPIWSTNLQNETKIDVKRIGKQIKWEYVFYMEYLGPIVIVPLLYSLGKKKDYSLRQSLAAIMAVSHFLKRELETIFVHVFSRKSMPLKRLFINSAHYWILFALMNGLQLFFLPKKITQNKSYIVLLLMFWALMQFLNLKCHQELASFRKKTAISENATQNQKSRGIPKGWGFQYVSCANYLWETLGWLGFSVLTKCYTSFLFTFVSGAQMTQWALKKHKQYKQQFGEKYPKERKAIFPFLL